MNKTERKMSDLLRQGREEFGVVSVKAEFEAEGTRPDELLRLVDVAGDAQLPLTVKIGGCEALRDLFDSKQIGARYVVAPMVETPYALSKYIAATNIAFSEDEQGETDFLFNVETSTAFDARNDLVEMASRQSAVSGVVFGRVDFVGSLGRGRDEINAPDITEMIRELAVLLKERELDLVVGGGVSVDSLDALRSIAEVHLSRFETRKVVFGAHAIDASGIERGLLNAVHFELLWLLNKREYYGRIAEEDARRISMLESRWSVLSGGNP